MSEKGQSRRFRPSTGYFRSTPNNGHGQVGPACLKGAISGSERTHSITSWALARSVSSRSCRAWWCRCVGGGYCLARISAFTYRRRLWESWDHSRRPSGPTRRR